MVRAEEAKERVRLAAEEREREAGLDAEADAWRRAQQIRAYAAAVSAAAPVPVPENIRNWINWANSVASRIDPLIKRVAIAEAGVSTPGTLSTRLPPGLGRIKSSDNIAQRYRHLDVA